MEGGLTSDFPEPRMAKRAMHEWTALALDDNTALRPCFQEDEAWVRLHSERASFSGHSAMPMRPNACQSGRNSDRDASLPMRER